MCCGSRTARRRTRGSTPRRSLASLRGDAGPLGCTNLQRLIAHARPGMSSRSRTRACTLRPASRPGTVSSSLSARERRLAGVLDQCPVVTAPFEVGNQRSPVVRVIPD
jgi:hypothetical protein